MVGERADVADSDVNYEIRYMHAGKKEIQDDDGQAVSPEKVADEMAV
jgi:hypothetical protein